MRLRQAGRALEVREDDRDGLANLLGRQHTGERRTAEPAQAEPRGILLAAIRADLDARRLTLHGGAHDLQTATWIETVTSPTRSRFAPPTIGAG